MIRRFLLMVSLVKRRSYFTLGAVSFAGFLLLASSPLSGAPATAPSVQTPSAVTSGVAKFVSHYTPTEKLRFTIALKPQNAAEQEQLIEDIYTKESPNFHKFLTADEWNARFAPSAADEQAIVNWANASGLTVTARHSHRLTISLEGNADRIEKAFSLKINNYQLGAQSFYSNDRDPVLPAHLAPAIQSVLGLNSKVQLQPKVAGKRISSEQPKYVPGPAFAEAGHGAQDGNASMLQPAAKASMAAKKNASASGPDPAFTGNLLDPTDLYNTNVYNWDGLNGQRHCCNPNGGTDSSKEASIAIATAYAIDPNDIIGFHNKYPYLAYNYTTYNIDGTPKCPAGDTECNLETTLDFEWATAMANSFGAAANTAHVHIYQGVNPNFSTFTDVVSRILSDSKVRVVSMSWGCAESDCWSGSDMNAIHNVFNAMIAQGYTVVVASGDNGATAIEGTGKGCAQKLAVDYPGSDPDVVSAGGTLITLNHDFTNFNETGWEGDTFTGACAGNDGGSGGGLSAVWSTPSYQTFLGESMRSVPDISLNAAAFQNVFFQGSSEGVGGTSIVAPELAGFFAQENAYLLAIGIGCGADHTQTCAPIGLPHPALYTLGHFPAFAPQYPYYDITAGCNSNDVTVAFKITAYCAQSGYDMVTGWGAANMLQLAWAMNSYFAGDFIAPNVTFSGPTPGVWYNTNQNVTFTVTDVGHDLFLANGVAGYSQAWDQVPLNVVDRGLGALSLNNAPQFPNGTSGSLSLSAAGQGCHQANVRAWDNGGTTQNVQSLDYCYDSVAPVTVAAFSGTLSGTVYTSPVTVTLSAVEVTSGVKGIFYSLDGKVFLSYSAPFTVSAPGTYMVRFYSTDNAGNTDSTHTESFTIQAAKTATTTTNVSSKNPSALKAAVTFTATVTSSGGTPTGNVTFTAGGSSIGTATLTNGKASLTISTLTLGAHPIQAKYAGAGKFAASASATLTQTVKHATSLSVKSSLNPSSSHQSVTFAATITTDSAMPPGTSRFSAARRPLVVARCPEMLLSSRLPL
jgi:subtilase family serine protease